MKFGKYSKLYVALAAALVGFINSQWGADVPLAQLAIGLIGAAGVYFADNTDDTEDNLG